jgi:hypothetical protein
MRKILTKEQFDKLEAKRAGVLEAIMLNASGQ